jgi:hypothetical protein
VIPLAAVRHCLKSSLGIFARWQRFISELFLTPLLPDLGARLCGAIMSGR